MAIINVCKLKGSRVYKTQRNVLWKVYCNVCSESFAVFLSGIFSGRDRLMCYSREQTALFICLIASVWSTTLQADMTVVAVTDASSTIINSNAIRVTFSRVRLVLPIADFPSVCPASSCGYSSVLVNKTKRKNRSMGEFTQVTNNVSWSDLAKRWSKMGPHSSTITANGTDYSFGDTLEICMGMRDATITSGWGPGFPAVPDPALCATVRPEGSNTCTVAGTALSIDHGQLSPGKLNAHQAEATTQVTCTAAASLKVTVIPSVIVLRRGVTSSLTINGQSDGEILKVGTGVTPLSIKSQLSVTGTPTAGSYSGSAVVMLDFE